MQKHLSKKRKRKAEKNKILFKQKVLPFIPTALLGLGLIVLGFITKNVEFEVRFEARNVFFTLDLEQDQKIELIRAIEIESIGIINAEPIKIDFAKLYSLGDDTTQHLLAELNTAKLIPEYRQYSELTFYEGDFKISAFEVGRNAKVGITLGDEKYANSLKLEVCDYPARLHLQLFSQSAKFMADKYEIFNSNGRRIVHPEIQEQEHFLFIPRDSSPISTITACENEIIANIELSNAAVKSTSVFDIGNANIGHGIPIKKLILSDFNIIRFIDADTITAFCTRLQVQHKKKEEIKQFTEKHVVYKPANFRGAKIKELHLLAGDESKSSKIALQLIGYTDAFYMGLSKESMRNLAPTMLEYLVGSPWALLLAALGWLITTSKLVYDLLASWRKK